ELSEEEKKLILNSQDFTKFFLRATTIVERAITEDVDIFVDYTGGDDEDKEGMASDRDRVTLGRQFFDDHWSRHRTVTCIDWSPNFSELIAAAYNQNEEAPHEPDGIVLVWNMKFAKKETPEFIFRCQSSVMSVAFSQFHPNIVIGGTHSGQVVLWDSRSYKRTPVQRTPLSAAAHTHPVFCIDVLGTQNANNLISICNDGKLCSWSLDMLSQPQDTMELQYKQKVVPVNCMAFPTNDVNNFIVGSEEGTVYSGSRHGNKAGINEAFESHQAPVAAISTHHANTQVDFTHLFLTSSFDWSVKLWTQKATRPLHSFEGYSDYVYDVKWSPIHPAVFASADGSGRLDLWNINKDTEVSKYSEVITNNIALNCLKWSQSGNQLVAGDADGKVYVYNVGENLALPLPDESSRLAATIQELQINSAPVSDGQQQNQLNLRGSSIR
ncbi:uncharacterized protein TRIADDRAFT_20566, partial [Trichoplax adhaerens]